MTSSIQVGICICLALVSPGCCSGSYVSINDCSPDPCKNGATCTDGILTFTCTCPTGYTGTLCETNINDCSANTCSMRGGCEDGVNGFTCTCQATCTGDTCNTCTDPTAETTPTCNNGGTPAGGLCFCATGFTGTNCDDVTCGDPPCYAYATRTSTGSAVTNTATYTCPTGFEQCVNPAMVTCQADGQWTALSSSNVCDRGTFSGNLVKWYLYPTPCQPSTYLRLSFTVTVYNVHSRFTIRGGNNILFEVRFVRLGYYWYTYFYYTLNGYYYYVWYYGVPFYLYTPTPMTITLQNGVYTFEALGSSVSRPEPVAGATPESFSFQDYMYVSNLSMDPTP